MTGASVLELLLLKWGCESIPDGSFLLGWEWGGGLLTADVLADRQTASSRTGNALSVD